MNLILDKILKDIQRIKIEEARENKDKKNEPKKVISIKKNKSIENFMKFQWTWTM
jgi:hypothetical protein